MRRNTILDTQYSIEPPVAVAAVLNPPTSRQVLERLAAFLTPPQSIGLQPPRDRRSGAYDNLAARCLAEVQQPDESKRWAFRACTEVIKRHSKSFYLSARLLPAGKRDDIMALYAFCRLSDDIVDNAVAGENRTIAMVKARLALDAWSKANEGLQAQSDHPVVVAWADARARHGIPQVLADDLIKGVRMDLTKSRYDTWDDLWLYSYRVASTVGLMSMYITGAETMAAVPYAVQLGVALQLTNILRDIGEDSRAGRIYLPREDMERFGYTEEMLMSRTVNRNFIALMQYEIEKARALYRAAEPGIAMLPADSRLAVAAASALYRGILGKIEEANYDVFSLRAHLSMSEKVRLLPGLWWRHQGAGVWAARRETISKEI